MSLADEDRPTAASIPDGDPRHWLRPLLRPLADAAAMNGPRRGDHDLNPGYRSDGPAPLLRPAAVLVPIVDRAAGLTVLLTRRSAHLGSHAGQVAFLGGRIDDTDEFGPRRNGPSKPSASPRPPDEGRGTPRRRAG